MGVNTKEITFYPKSKYIKDIIDPPKPTLVPQWFKKLPIYQGSSELIVFNGETNQSAKTCIPFLDSLTSGYTFNLWCDIQVKNSKTNTGKLVTWGNTAFDLIPIQDRPDPGLPIFQGFDPMFFSWKSHWGIKTPKGYSCILTHPFNRTDLPFITSTGIMDTDKWGIWGNQPFSFIKDFEGIIPAGTPIIQIIPFKRDNWKSKIDDSLTDWANKEEIKGKSIFRGYYKNNYWQKKKYQ
jgi:hypothetical protein